MKLIIDINEKIEEYIKDYIPIGAGDNVFCYPDEIVRMIQNGTPIPDNATNGDVLISLYPNLKYTIQNGRVVTTIGVASSFDLDWWNTPYQKGGK